MAIFADVQYCIYADILSGWVGPKKSSFISPGTFGVTKYLTSSVCFFYYSFFFIKILKNISTK